MIHSFNNITPLSRNSYQRAYHILVIMVDLGSRIIGKGKKKDMVPALVRERSMNQIITLVEIQLQAKKSGLKEKDMVL